MAKDSLITDSPSRNTQVPNNSIRANSPRANDLPPQPPLITGRQCRAARAMLQWSREELSERSGVHYITLCNFELGHCTLKPGSARLLRMTFVASGLLFIDEDGNGGPGVCLALPVG